MSVLLHDMHDLHHINDAFLAEIDAFCERNRMEEWRYGTLFARCSKLTERLRAGVGIQSTSVSAILTRAAEYEASHPEPVYLIRRTGRSRRAKTFPPLRVAA